MIDEQLYRYYMADSVRLIPQKAYVHMRLCELMKNKPEDMRTGEEILIDTIKGAGLIV